MKIRSFLLAMMLCALCCVPAHALEYSFDAPEDYLFGQPTSDDTIYEWEDPNVDRSKNAALIAPGFGTPTSYLPGSGEYLTPNLVPGQYPSVGGSITATQIPGSGPTDIAQGSGYTEVTSGLYYANGSLGILKIPSIGLTVGIYEGTGSAPLLKGAGHFTNTSIWDGNVALAGHNRGVRNDFGKLHTLSAGDTVTLTTMLGTRTYSVASVEKVNVNDSSGTAPTTDNRVTLYTCVMNQPEYRWKVTAIQQG